MLSQLTDTAAVVFRCVPCPIGTHNPHPNATGLRACVPCAVPAYVPNRPTGGASICVQCAPGKASTNGMGCSDCGEGNFSANGLVCARCAPGAYAADVGRAQCDACPIGTF
jgi:hypothetical protein